MAAEMTDSLLKSLKLFLNMFEVIVLSSSSYFSTIDPKLKPIIQWESTEEFINSSKLNAEN